MISNFHNNSKIRARRINPPIIPRTIANTGVGVTIIFTQPEKIDILDIVTKIIQYEMRASFYFHYLYFYIQYFLNNMFSQYKPRLVFLSFVELIPMRSYFSYKTPKWALSDSTPNTRKKGTYVYLYLPGWSHCH